jgi:hypothetical protein
LGLADARATFGTAPGRGIGPGPRMQVEGTIFSKMLLKIKSGGQTDADRAGLDFAIEADLEHGGYVPRGRKAEDGRIDDRYNLIELSTARIPREPGGTSMAP